MDYDKNSFLAGVSVGRTLKGWACGSGSGGVPSLGGGVLYSDAGLSIGYTGAVLSHPAVIAGTYEEVDG